MDSNLHLGCRLPGACEDIFTDLLIAGNEAYRCTYFSTDELLGLCSACVTTRTCTRRDEHGVCHHRTDTERRRGKDFGKSTSGCQRRSGCHSVFFVLVYKI